MHYVVIEIYERECCSATPCPDEDSAVQKANELLDARIAELGLTKDDLDRDSDYQEATSGNTNAWCNHKGNWDAHVVSVPTEVD